MDLPTVIEGEELEFRDVIPAEASRRVGQAMSTGEQQKMVGRDIMIAIDHGPNSKHAFDWALVNLCRESDTVHLIHAVSSVRNEVVYEMSRTLMEKLALEAAKVAMVKTSARIVEGDPSKVICQVADKLKPAAVVLGTRGRSLVKSVLQGSVSQYCLHHCKSAPIIVVPGKGQIVEPTGLKILSHQHHQLIEGSPGNISILIGTLLQLLVCLAMLVPGHGFKPVNV